jgi:hypothetical protein
LSDDLIACKAANGLVDLYSEAFTPELIALFERKTWTLDDLLTLPLAENDGLLHPVCLHPICPS